ncbi:emp24p/erv25p- protein [Cladochytrium tenue]|nr:emp24p/erv25p- protein [Cladochytrium tenue]
MRTRTAVAAVALASLALMFAAPARALYFILEGYERKCFLEELSKDTTVIGTFTSALWNEDLQKFFESPKLSVAINVEVGIHVVQSPTCIASLMATFHIETGHSLVNQKGSTKGRFTFTISDPGSHRICFSASSSAWFGTSKTKLTLDLMFGDITHDVTSGKKAAVKDLADVVLDLKMQAWSIQREQRYQRDREAAFRDTSEATNSKVVHWTIAQVVVLGA